ncbi:hypothetical protein FRC12_002282 [Ceratobasidium sp. 428]|nr:hypothetical protein FRC12_002282 [Ceratobasidium sp. 428]
MFIIGMGETCNTTLSNPADGTPWLDSAEAGEGDGGRDVLLVHSAQIDTGSNPGWRAWPRDRVDEYFPWLRPFWRRRWTPGDFVSLTFVFLVIAMTSLVLFGMIKVLLNPDKYTAPTRPDCTRSPTSLPPYVDLSILSQVGIFVGVMSVGTEAGFRRRDAIRSTWARQNDGMNRTVVKFIIGQGGGRELEMENELYGDIVMLPPKQTYFSWAYEHALVPDLADEWVQPDYVVQTGDKSVVDLLELEARLRVEWYVARGEDTGSGSGPLIYSRDSSMYALSWSVVSYVAEHGMNRRYQMRAEDLISPGSAKVVIVALDMNRLGGWGLALYAFVFGFFPRPSFLLSKVWLYALALAQQDGFFVK